MARMVATKAALSIRVDALTDADGKSEDQAPSIGLENRAKLESRLRALEHQSDMSGVRRYADDGKKQQKFSMKGDTQTYNTAADAVDLVSTQREPLETAIQAVLEVKDEKKKAKEERKAKRKAEKEKAADSDVGDKMDVDGESKESKKEKKRKRRESEVNGQVDAEEAKVGFRPSYFSFYMADCPCRMVRLKPSVRRGSRHVRLKRPLQQQPRPMETLQRRRRKRAMLDARQTKPL